MKKLLLIISLILSASAYADNEQQWEMLDHTITQRNSYIQQKENRIEALRKKLTTLTDSIAMLKTLDNLYNEYHVFKFDSAATYANEGLALALRQHDQYYTAQFTIHQAEILALGGFYSEGINNLETLNIDSLDRQQLFRYYFTRFTLYRFWSDYCHDQEYAPQYLSMAYDNLKKAIGLLSTEDAYYDYYMGEYYFYIHEDVNKANEYYHRMVDTRPDDSRFYAMASFALARNYMEKGNQQKQIEYLIKAALCDIKCSTMENLALQTLAVWLFQNDKKQIERAERYIGISMEDAKFYNNRLRILEISRTLQEIMKTYQTTIKQQNRDLRNSIFFISLLVLALIFATLLIYRQNRKLNARRIELATNNQELNHLNQELAESNRHQTELNQQLNQLNQRLVDTNKRREGLAYIYIELCAKYIDKLSKYQTLVKRKIKAHQEKDLLQTVTSVRIPEEDATIFLSSFDKAFLELYPTFVEEFNALLTEEGQIHQKTSFTLTTELRTFALIRLGVKNTADIAGLLFLSTQTIYNCRSLTKNKAINVDTFDEDVKKLCTVI